MHAPCSRSLSLVGAPAVQFPTFPAAQDPVRLVIGPRLPATDKELSYPLAP